LENLQPGGQRRTRPGRSYPANGYGLYGGTGNVWEWTSDFYRPSHAAGHPGGDGLSSGDEAPMAHACCGPGGRGAALTAAVPATNPTVDAPEGSYDPDEPGGAHIPRRVIKGGSHLCAENYCPRYRPAGRQAQQLDSGMSHIGFRCIVRPG
jgi:formylglycine-generating enzyme required for sulfatase activity